ncbi:carbon-monoxide dehydrogenase small subunit [Phyllobacterium sp. 1468]|uniref:(2Fe-2S)-binding protein n=1 Tax=Phyllobacterium sp. 1468 TaxID=2817759 RepID=UPI0028600EB6|nr:2Fe-2S iron-sulfur cluster-binding protein [Phyllobacterium sp. 1468]MDR6632627.1 carbon-monoxide dehydrogenase small subunit [Phyllobacterium sp. 1468]
MRENTLTLIVNGSEREVPRDAQLLLVDVLREDLGLKATHIGCLSGDCGACSVMIDGEVRKSCLNLAVATEGRAVVTLEGQGSVIMRALQAAFISANAFQCGFCTAGMLMAAADLLKRNPEPGTEEIRQAISGNLCRCTGYEPIVNAIQEVAQRK